jgi:hypothetical protein
LNQDRPSCVGCSRVLSPEEQERARVACFRCEEEVKEALTALAGPDGLFAQLVWRGVEALTPGSGRSNSDPNVKTSKVTAPSPVRLDAVNLLGAGGLVHTLQRWINLWYKDLGFRQPVWRGQFHFVILVAPGGTPVRRPGQLDNAVKVLLNNLPWACEQRADFGEFRHQVRGFVEQSRSAIDPTIERKVRIQVGRCPTKVGDLICGRPLMADPFAPSIHCINCNTVWPRARWLDLGAAIQG